MNQNKLLEAFHVVLKGIAFQEQNGTVENLQTSFHPEEGFVVLSYDSVREGWAVSNHTVRIFADGTVKEEK